MAAGSDSPSPSKISRVNGGLRSGLTLTLLIVTELIKWLAILAAVYLGVWQYCDLTNAIQDAGGAGQATDGYAKCTLGQAKSIAHFWAAFTGIIVGISVVLYLPWRIFAVSQRFKYYIFRDERWRPAILIYILLGAIPAFVLVLAATQTTTVQLTKLEPVTVTALQMVVMGLVVTEWTAKVQQERFTFDLLTAMASDFFFAYEVIAFVMVATNQDVYNSAWLYPCFIFAIVAMFKYLPTVPVSFQEHGVSWGYVVHIIVALLCIEIPFVVIRLSTMILFHYFLISDMIFLIKNWSIIIFSSIQLALIFSNRNKSAAEAIPQPRRFRGPEVWCDANDAVCRVRVGAVNIESSNNNNDDVPRMASVTVG